MLIINVVLTQKGPEANQVILSHSIIVDLKSLLLKRDFVLEMWLNLTIEVRLWSDVILKIIHSRIWKERANDSSKNLQIKAKIYLNYFVYLKCLWRKFTFSFTKFNIWTCLSLSNFYLANLLSALYFWIYNLNLSEFIFVKALQLLDHLYNAPSQECFLVLQAGLQTQCITTFAIATADRAADRNFGFFHILFINCKFIRIW